MSILKLFVFVLVMTTKFSWYHKTHLQIEKIEVSLEEFKSDCGFYPSNEEGFNELIHSDKDCWNGPYAAPVMFKDKLQRKKYAYDAQNETYEIVSAGLDGEFGTNDDFKSSDDSKEKSRIYSLYESNSKKSTTKIFIFSVIVLALAFIFWFIRKRKKQSKTNQET